MNSRGVTLVLLLSFILAVIVMANVALLILASQTKLSFHQVSRIQAYYAAQAGINYALERLRVNDSNWPVPSSNHELCRGCSGADDIDEPDLPASVNKVLISLSDTDGDGIVEIRATAEYRTE